MDKHNKILVKMFDGTQFSVWKYYMKIVFEAKKVLQLVFGLKKDCVPISLENITSQELS